MVLVAAGDEQPALATGAPDVCAGGCRCGHSLPSLEEVFADGRAAAGLGARRRSAGPGTRAGGEVEAEQDDGGALEEDGQDERGAVAGFHEAEQPAALADEEATERAGGDGDAAPGDQRRRKAPGAPGEALDGCD